MLLRAVFGRGQRGSCLVFLKVTDEYFSGHKTTPNELCPVCQSFFCLCLLGMPSVLQAASCHIVLRALPLSPNQSSHYVA